MNTNNGNENGASFPNEPRSPATTTSSGLNASLTSVAKGATIIFGGLIVGNFLGMANQIILGRFLGPDDYGLYNLSMSVVMIAGVVCVFGFFGSLPRFIPFHLKKNERDVVRSVIDFSSLFSFTLGTILAVATYLLSDRVAVTVFHDPRLAPALKVFAFAIPLHGVQQVAQAAIRGFKAAKYEALVFHIGSRIVTLAVFLLSLFVVRKLYGAIIAYVVGILVTAVVALWLIRKRIFTDYGKHPRVGVARSVLSFSWPLALTGFTYLFVTKTDRLMLGYFLTSLDVGIYSPAAVIASLLDFINNAFKYRFLPTVSEYFSKNDMIGLEPLYKSTSRWSFLLVYPIFLFIMVFPKELLTILYGSKYAGGAMALVVLSLGIAVNDFSGTSANILVAGGRTRLNLLCEIIAAVTNIGLNALLIPIYGIVGAAIATAMSYVTRNITSLTFCYRSYGMHPYTRKYLNIIVSGLAAIAIVYILKIYSPFSWWVTTVVLGVLFVVLYVTAVVLGRGLEKTDLLILEGIERKTRLKLGFLKRFVG
jgi:O-antigen/teichoic acid export membrane protein